MSGARTSNPRRDCIAIEPVGNSARFKLTDLGYAKITEMATLGCDKKEIAEYLRVTPGWLSEILGEFTNDPDARAAYTDGITQFKIGLRTAQKALSESNAQMAIHLGKHHLGQHDQVQVDINQKIQVVGTLPNYSLKAEDWAAQFGPGGQALQIEDDKAQRVQEAEYVDVEPPK